MARRAPARGGLYLARTAAAGGATHARRSVEVGLGLRSQRTPLRSRHGAAAWHEWARHVDAAARRGNEHGKLLEPAPSAEAERARLAGQGRVRQRHLHLRFLRREAVVVTDVTQVEHAQPVVGGQDHHVVVAQRVKGGVQHAAGGRARRREWPVTQPARQRGARHGEPRAPVAAATHWAHARGTAWSRNVQVGRSARVGAALSFREPARIHKRA